MLVVVKESDFTVEHNHYFSEASTLGLRPGQWPDFLVIADELGYGKLVKFRHMGQSQDPAEDMEWADYESVDKDGPDSVTIYND